MKYTKIYLAISLIITVGVLFSTPAHADDDARYIDRSCKDIEVIFARGSGQDKRDKEADAFIGKIENKFIKSPITISSHELGVQTYGGKRYEYVNVGNVLNGNAIGAFLSAGQSNDYGHSVKQGIGELTSYLGQRFNRCNKTQDKDTYYVLAGYSQGAQVMGQSLESIPKEIRNNIAFVALFGDPKLYLPEGKGLHPAACKGKDYSTWRRTIGDCHTDNGSLGARKPTYIPTDMKNKTGLWCASLDYVCGTSKIVIQNSGHGKYSENRDIENAVSEIARKLKASWKQDPKPNPTPKPNPEPETPPEDLIDTSMPEPALPKIEYAVALNSSYLMRAYIEDAAREAVNSARSFLQSTDGYGKIALVSFRDADSEYSAKVISDFTDDINEFEDAIITKLDYEKTLSDEPEGALHGYMTAMKELSWSAPGESLKGIHLISNTGFHEPDLTDGSTQKDVIQETYRLGGVTLTAGVRKEVMEDYQYITKATDGMVSTIIHLEPDMPLSLGDNRSVAMRTTAQATPGQVVANIDNLNYSARPGDSITFSASSSYVNNATIVQYEWDIDGDGITDYASTDPTFEYTYSQTFSGLIRMRATDEYGRRAYGFAQVSIENKAPQPLAAAPLRLNATIIDSNEHTSTVEIKWDAQDTNAERWILALNDNALGHLTSERRNVIITDVEREYATSFRLVAENKDSIQSSTAEVIVPSFSGDTTVPDLPALETPEPPTPEEPETPTEPGTPPKNPCEKHTNYFIRMACETAERLKAQARAFLGQFYFIIGVR